MIEFWVFNNCGELDRDRLRSKVAVLVIFTHFFVQHCTDKISTTLERNYRVIPPASILHGVKIVQTQYINFRGLFCYVMNLYNFDAM
jgi:hypothetical protein